MIPESRDRRPNVAAMRCQRGNQACVLSRFHPARLRCGSARIGSAWSYHWHVGFLPKDFPHSAPYRGPIHVWPNYGQPFEVARIASTALRWMLSEPWTFLKLQALKQRHGG